MNQNAPNNAIYEGGVEWRMSDGTALSGSVTTPMKNTYEADNEQDAVSMDFFLYRY